jgi:hypothetical protein
VAFESISPLPIEFGFRDDVRAADGGNHLEFNFGIWDLASPIRAPMRRSARSSASA